VGERIYHVWFGTKKRIAALQGDIGSDIKQLLVEIAREVGIGLMEMGTSADHMHLVIRVSEDRTLELGDAPAQGGKLTLDTAEVSRTEDRHGTAGVLAEGLRLSSARTDGVAGCAQLCEDSGEAATAA